MKYNFDEVIDRLGTNCIKWDFMNRITGIDESCTPLWIADMDFRCAKPIIDAVETVAKHGIYGYSDMPESYYTSVVNWMERRHGWKIDKNQICVTPGIVKALNFIVKEFTEIGEGVIVQTPVYGPFMNAIKSNGRVIVENKLKYDGIKYEIDFEDLENKLKDENTKLMLLCSPHNPISKVWTKEDLTKLGNLCIENNVIVVSDEIHSDIVYKGYKHTPFASINNQFAKNSIICTAPSKTFNIAGLETSNIIIYNENLRKRYKSELDRNGIKGHNPFGISATEAAYNYGEEWLDQLMDYLTKNVSYVQSFIDNHIPELNIIKPEGTFLLWLDFRKLGLDNSELKELLEKKAKIALDKGENFGGNGEGFLRLNIGCSRDILRSALQRLSDALNSK